MIDTDISEDIGIDVCDGCDDIGNEVEAGVGVGCTPLGRVAGTAGHIFNVWDQAGGTCVIGHIDNHSVDGDDVLGRRVEDG